MMSPPELNSKSDAAAVADARETRSATPAATNEASDIQINSRNLF
jgi:hypothetical protein